MSIHKQRNTIRESSSLGQPLCLTEKTYYSGFFRILAKQSYQVIDRIKYIEIELHNSSGKAYALCDCNLFIDAKLKHYELVKLLAYKKNVDANQLYIQQITPARSNINIHSILSLPRKLSSEPKCLERLVSIRNSIASPALARFVDTIFSDNEIALAFLQVPASRNHHHSNPGGLLEHSVEVAENVALHTYRNNDERDIAVVAALLHDIGKVRTLKADTSTTQLGKMVGHDDLTLEVCATALKELDKDWLDASYTLRHVWTCATPGSKYGYEQNCNIARIVQKEDGLSACRYDENQLFKLKKQNDGLTWDGKKYHWRPTAEPLITKWRTMCLKSNTH